MACERAGEQVAVSAPDGSKSAFGGAVLVLDPALPIIQTAGARGTEEAWWVRLSAAHRVGGGPREAGIPRIARQHVPPARPVAREAPPPLRRPVVGRMVGDWWKTQTHPDAVRPQREIGRERFAPAPVVRRGRARTCLPARRRRRLTAHTAVRLGRRGEDERRPPWKVCEQAVASIEPSPCPRCQPWPQTATVAERIRCRL